jgi:pyridoxal phosphate enzyme (YggS family)
MSDYPDLPERLATVRDTIARHQRRAGHQHSVRIVAVTKGHGPEAVRAARAAGLTDVAENRVQEALGKMDATADVEVTWHLIGSLQRNKVKSIVGRFGWIHSVDRVELVEELARRLPAGGRQRVLLEVNCSGESQKGGIDPSEAPALARAVAAHDSLQLEGLMTMAALTENEDRIRGAFRRLRELKDELERAGHRLPELSMGMSGDFAIAVEEGATMVRLGTLLFGERRQ